MLYGEAKTREITRSVLPASRKMARRVRKEKRRWNQTVRRRMDREIAIRPGSTATEAIEAFENDSGTWFDTYSPEERHRMKRIRNRRRDNDKLGPVRSWTRSLQKEYDDPYELIEFIRRELPDNLAGRHAADHMQWEFGPRDRPWIRINEHRSFERACRYAEWEGCLLLVIERNLGGLNRKIKIGNSSMRGCPTWKCRGRAVFRDDDRYVDSKPCDACGRAVVNYNIRPVVGSQDLDRLREDLRKSHYAHPGLMEWVAVEARRLSS